MECPKCGAEIDKRDLVCPNCKKVLKMICPVCKTINTGATCRKCGKVLVTKCVNCGKINMTKNVNCVKCGHSTEQSVIQNESKTEDFALLTIEFPNITAIKDVLGSNKLFFKFKENLDIMISEYLRSVGIRRQIIGDKYVIRFNKVYTFEASARAVIDSTIELIKLVSKLNIKLLTRKNVTLKSNFTIIKRSIEDDPYDFNSGFNANMLGQSAEVSERILSAFQVITDEDFVESFGEKYKMNALETVSVNGKMKRLYEMDLQDFIKVNELITQNAKKEEEDVEIPKFIQTAIERQEQESQNYLNSENSISDAELYNINLFNFDEVYCEFKTVKNIDAIGEVISTLKKVPFGVLAIQSSEVYKPFTLNLLSEIANTGLYENIIPISCHERMKYTPYSFFRDLILSVFDYAVSHKLASMNNFNMFDDPSLSDLVADLVNLTRREMVNIEQIRSDYYGLFSSVLQAIPKSVIYVENFDKIDESSRQILEKFFEVWDEYNISFVMSCDSEYSLHKKMHFMISRPYYTQITLTPCGVSEIVSREKDIYKNVLDDFYFQRIAKYSLGSKLFLDLAVQYLVESGVYEYSKDNSVVMINPKTVIIPSGTDALMKRRIVLLQEENRQELKFLTAVALIGTRVDFNTINLLEIENWQDIAEKLSQKGYLYTFNNCIYFQNYNLLLDNLLSSIDNELMREVASLLFEKVFVEGAPSSVKAYIYSVLGNNEQEIFEWENLANTNISAGDFAAYMNCSTQILKCLDTYAGNWSPDELEKYKTSIYENIANNMYEYNPEANKEIAEKTLLNLQKNASPLITDFCPIMLQGAVTNGDYIYAQSILHKALSFMTDASINPSSGNFNLNLLVMSMIHVKILFNLGYWEDCYNIGYNIFNVLDTSKIENMNYTIISKDEFKVLMNECIAYIAIINAISMKDNISEFLDRMSKLFKFIPKDYLLFVQLQKLILTGKSNPPSGIGDSEDPFVNILFYVLKAFSVADKNIEEFAKNMYKAKLISRDYAFLSIEYISDILIGYAYSKTAAYKKSYSIYYKVLKSAQEKGMNPVMLVCWYLISSLYIKQHEFENAYSVLTNSEIHMEKNGYLSPYILLLNKVNMYIVLKCKGDEEKAQLCLNQAQKLVAKYKINFNLNIDISEILRENHVEKSEPVKPIREIPQNPDIPEERDPDLVNPTEFYSQE